MSSRVSTTTTPAHTSSGTSQPASFGTPPSAGNSLIVEVHGSPPGTSLGVPTCADNQSAGNTYTLDKSKQQTTGSYVVVFRCHNLAVGSGTFTVTASGFPSGSEITVTVTEVSGLQNAAPETSNSNGSTTGIPTTGSITTTNASGNYIVIVMANDNAGNPTTVTTPTNYSSIYKETNGSSFCVGEHADRATSGTVSGENPAWNTGSVPWSACIVAYKNTAAADTLMGQACF